MGQSMQVTSLRGESPSADNREKESQFDKHMKLKSANNLCLEADTSVPRAFRNKQISKNAALQTP